MMRTNNLIQIQIIIQKIVHIQVKKLNYKYLIQMIKSMIPKKILNIKGNLMEIPIIILGSILKEPQQLLIRRHMMVKY